MAETGHYYFAPTRGLSDAGVFVKIQDKHGLAEVASQWFMNTHAHYLSASKDVFTEIEQPLLLLGKEVDKEKFHNEKQAAFTEAYSTLKIGLAKAIAKLGRDSLLGENLTEAGGGKEKAIGQAAKLAIVKEGDKAAAKVLREATQKGLQKSQETEKLVGGGLRRSKNGEE